MNLNQKHLISLLSYLGVGFIGGSISHGFFSGTRSVIMALIGLFLFLLGEILNKDINKNWTETIVFGLLYSLSIGMISGGFQHFLDSPERSLWIIPIGFFLSWLVFGAKNKRENFNRKSIILGVVTTGLLFGAGRSAMRYLPASIYSSLAHDHTNSLQQHDNHDNNTSSPIGQDHHDMVMDGDDHNSNDHNSHKLTSGVSGATQGQHFMLTTNTTTYTPGVQSLFSFYPQVMIGGDGLKTIDDLEISHEKYIHLILVRKDGGEFLHLHPSLQADGSWSTPITFPSAGERYVYADIISKEFGKQVLTKTILIEGSINPFVINPLIDTGIVITQSGIQTTLSRDTPTTLAPSYFTVSVNNALLENYLGAKGHMVAINLDDMSYSHVHPLDATGENKSTTQFMAHFEKPGIYRIFIQLQINGTIHTIPLSIKVS